MKCSVDQARFHQTRSSALPGVPPVLQPRAGTRCSHAGFAGQAPVLQRRTPRSPKSPEFDRALIVLNLQTPLPSIFSSRAGLTLLSVACKSRKITAVHVITQMQKEWEKTQLQLLVSLSFRRSVLFKHWYNFSDTFTRVLQIGYASDPRGTTICSTSNTKKRTFVYSSTCRNHRLCISMKKTTSALSAHKKIKGACSWVFVFPHSNTVYPVREGNFGRSALQVG